MQKIIRVFEKEKLFKIAVILAFAQLKGGLNHHAVKQVIEREQEPGFGFV